MPSRPSPRSSTRRLWAGSSSIGLCCRRAQSVTWSKCCESARERAGSRLMRRMPRRAGYGCAQATDRTGRGTDRRRYAVAAQMVNVEVGPTAFDLLALDRAPLHTYFHANKYLRLDISQDPSPSSDHRMKVRESLRLQGAGLVCWAVRLTCLCMQRYEQYPTPQDAGDVATILSDNEDRAYPIFRRPRPTDDEWTLATAMFDLLHGELQIYVQKPANAPSVVRLDF
eukprot:scaffold273_cov349-Prasinococcus_capsulatus_cf.AAC.1